MLPKRTFSSRPISAAFWSLQILPKLISPPPKVCPLRDTMVQEHCCLDKSGLAGHIMYVVGDKYDRTVLFLLGSETTLNLAAWRSAKSTPCGTGLTCGFLSAVVVTIGPSCQDVDALCQLLHAGATCARCDLTVSFFCGF